MPNQFDPILYLFRGESKTLSQWSKNPVCPVSYHTLVKRVISLNWSIEKALTVPKVIFKSLVGLKSGRLTVVKDSLNRDKAKNIIWLCKCDCGKEKLVNTKNLNAKEGKGTKSCGCLVSEGNGQRKCRKEFSLTILNTSFYNYKRSARLRNLDFFLSSKDFIILITNNCHYCNGFSDFNKIIPNGIDRMDNKKGYTTNNCVACCMRCNYAKHTMSVEEFKQHITKIYNNLTKTNR